MPSFNVKEYSPLVSSSMGCLRAVMSRNVHRNKTTVLRSFLTGEIWSRSHSGIPRNRMNKTFKTSSVGLFKEKFKKTSHTLYVHNNPMTYDSFYIEESHIALDGEFPVHRSVQKWCSCLLTRHT
jgi:hypothetical protein